MRREDLNDQVDIRRPARALSDKMPVVAVERMVAFEGGGRYVLSR